VKYDSYLKTTGFEKLLQQSIVPQNGLIRFLDAKPETTRYIWCNVAYTAEAMSEESVWFPLSSMS
jgi:hypothetical protein